LEGGLVGAEAGSVFGPVGTGIGFLAGAGLAYYTGAVAGEAAADAVSNAISNTDCQNNNGCQPCKTVSGRIVPVGTIGYRPLDILPDNVQQHGVYGSHHNIFVANQNPNNCQCFWQKQKYVLKPDQITTDMIPVEPFIQGS